MTTALTIAVALAGTLLLAPGAAHAGSAAAVRHPLATAAALAPAKGIATVGTSPRDDGDDSGDDDDDDDTDFS
jgi:hypothetical protein